MIKGVIFDLDGVLTHTSEEHFQAWGELAQSLGGELRPEIQDATRGISRQASLAVVLDAIGLGEEFSAAERHALAERKNQRYLELIEQFTPANLEPGAERLLHQLSRLGIRLGLASASRNAAGLIDKLGIARWFDYIVDPAKIDRGKPDPEMFIVAAQGLGLAPEECLGVEDAAAGVAAIQAAGMAAVGIGREAVRQADWRFDNLAQAADWLIDYVKEQNNGKR